jgi:outer membrane protein
VREAVIKTFHNFKVAQSLIKSNQSSVDAFTIALHGTKQEYMAGLRTTLDVLDAEQNLFEAKTLLIQSKRDEIVESYSLLAQLGKLTIKDLDIKIDTYNPEINYNRVKYKFIGF